MSPSFGDCACGRSDVPQLFYYEHSPGRGTWMCDRCYAEAEASVPPDGVAPESYAMGFRAGLERAAQIIVDEIDGGEEERGRDAMLSRLAAKCRALSAPAQEETP